MLLPFVYLNSSRTDSTVQMRFSLRFYNRFRFESNKPRLQDTIAKRELFVPDQLVAVWFFKKWFNSVESGSTQCRFLGSSSLLRYGIFRPNRKMTYSWRNSGSETSVSMGCTITFRPRSRKSE